MTTSLKIRCLVALALLAGGVYLHQNPQAMDRVSAVVSSPLELFGFKSTVLQAYIVEETSKRSTLPQEQIIAIQKASSIGIKPIDKDVVGPDNKPPAELIPFLKAAEGKQLPQLARKWSNGRTTSVAMPATFEKLKETK
jgi:hypothetical protein